jgi:hypothetical protein
MEAKLTEAKTESKMFGTKVIEINWIAKENYLKEMNLNQIMRR